MLALVGAFLAGVLTTLAPCVLPLLPVVVGGAVVPVPGVAPDRDVRRAVVVTLSLVASVLAFTLLLRASTVLLGVDPAVWRWVSGGLLIALGVVSILPGLWDRVSIRIGFQAAAQERLAAAQQRRGDLGAVLTGAALGPVFTSCSPLYAYVVVTVVPARPAWGTVLLAAYALGLGVTLLAVALVGAAADPEAGLAGRPARLVPAGAGRGVRADRGGGAARLGPGRADLGADPLASAAVGPGQRVHPELTVHEGADRYHR